MSSSFDKEEGDSGVGGAQCACPLNLGLVFEIPILYFHSRPRFLPRSFAPYSRVFKRKDAEELLGSFRCFFFWVHSNSEKRAIKINVIERMSFNSGKIIIS